MRHYKVILFYDSVPSHMFQFVQKYLEKLIGKALHDLWILGSRAVHYLQFVVYRLNGILVKVRRVC